MQYLETMKAILPLVLIFLSTTMLAQNIPSIEQVEAELEELKKKDDLRTYALNVIKHYRVLLQLMQENIDNSQEDITELNYELRRARAKFTSSLDSATWVNSQLNSELQDLNDSLQHLEHTIDSLIIGDDIMPITRENAVFSSYEPWDDFRDSDLNERIMEKRDGYEEWPNKYYFGDLTLEEEKALIDSAIYKDSKTDSALMYILEEDSIQNRYRLSNDSLTFYLVHVIGDVYQFKSDMPYPNPILLYQITEDGLCRLLSVVASINIPIDNAAEILNINPNSDFFTESSYARYEDSDEFRFDEIEDIYILNNKPPFLVGIVANNFCHVLTPCMRLISLFLITENGLNSVGHFPLKAFAMASSLSDSLNPCVDFTTTLTFSKSIYSYGLPNIICTKTYDNGVNEQWENYCLPCLEVGPYELNFTFDGKQYILQEDE